MKRLTALFALLACSTLAIAEDWPQWMGPKRDNVWRETGLLEKFPADGPKVIWRVPVQGGYAGPAVANGKVFVTDFTSDKNAKIENFDRKTVLAGTERVLCLDEKTGKELWKHSWPVSYSISYPAGPRCTPNVEGDLVYVLGAEGHFLCLNVNDGKVVWSKDLQKDYKTKAALWGYSAHPLIDGDNILTLAGGSGSHIVAFNKKTGKEVWKSQTASEQGYSPPTIFNYGNARQLILLAPDAVISVDPANGKKHWSVPYAASNGSIIMSPVMIGEYLYVAGYSNKNLLLKMDKDKPAVTEVWRDKNRQAVAPVNVQPLVDNGTLYGVDQNGVFYGIEIPSGKRIWDSTVPFGGKKRNDSGTVFFVKEGERYWFFNDSGELLIGKLSPKGFEEIDRKKIIEPTNLAFGRDVVWCMPAFANKKLYVRNDKECICVDLAK